VIGRQLGHFEILAEVGAGGMGTVYRARDLTLHRTVAVKVLPPTEVSEERRRRFLAEARAASALNHHGIVTVYEVGTEGEVDYIAMELVEGESLARRLARGPLSEAEAKRSTALMAEALSVAHAAGVIHRDLKPGNVMLTPNEELKILDFGLAKRLAMPKAGASDDLPTMTAPAYTANGAIIGTPAYMAPEQASGQPVDRRADLFALGCILYEMLTGERPFRGGGSVEVLSAILRDEPPPPSSRRRSISSAWDPIVGRLLAKDPDARYASAEQLLADLRRLDEPKRGPAGHRTRLPWLVPAALAGLLLVSLVIAWWPRGGTPSGGTAAATDPFPDYRFRLVADLPGSQREPSLSPDGRMVAFVMEDAEGVAQIWVMDLAGAQPIQVTSGGRGAGGPRWSVRGDRIVFGRAGDGIWEVPPLGSDPHQLLSTGHSPALSPDGSLLAYNDERRLWVAGADGSDPRPLEGFEPLHFGSFGKPAFSPDGVELVTFWPHSDRPLGDLWIAPVAGGEPRRLTELTFLSWSTAPVWTPDGRWIVFTSDHGGSTTLWRVSVDGAQLEPVTVGAGSDYDPDVSRDMRRIVYANGRNVAKLEIHDPESGPRRVVYERRDLLITPRVSPDGRQVAFFSRAGGSFHLFVADLESGTARQVTHGSGQVNAHPVWAADGNTLYYYRQGLRPDSTSSYRRISVEGRRDEQLLADWRWPVQSQTTPSPDETRLVYLLRAAGRNLETRVRVLDTGEEHALPKTLYDPLWTADGEEIYGGTSGDRGSSGEVHFCAADGAGCRRVGDGWSARLSADETTLYTLRGSPPVVWRYDLESGAGEALFTLEDYDPVDFGWGIGPGGEIVAHAQYQGELELWIGEADPEGAAGGLSP